MPLLVTPAQRAMLHDTAPDMLPRSLATVLAQNHTRVLDLFRVADENLDGVVSRGELAHLLRKLGIEFSHAELADLFDTLDPDQSGGIEFRELQRALRQASVRPMPPPMPPSGHNTPSLPSRRRSPLHQPPAPRADEASQGPPTAEEVRLLEEMLGVAGAAAGGVLSTNESASGVNLVGMLSAYEIVLQRHGLVPVEDTRFYHLVLQLSLMPQPNWRAKIAALRSLPTRHTQPSSKGWMPPSEPSVMSASLPASPVGYRARSPLASLKSGKGFRAASPRAAPPTDASSVSSGYGAIPRPSELAMRVGMLASDAGSPAMRGQASQLRAALRFDAKPMIAEEAEAYARFRLRAVTFRAWRAVSVEGANRAFKGAVARWVSAVSFWEQRLCRRCLLGLAGYVALLQQATYRCAGLTARHSLQRHWHAFRMVYQQRCFDKQKLHAALAHWGLRLASTTFDAWRTFYLMSMVARGHDRTHTIRRALARWRTHAVQGAEYRRKASLLASSHTGVVRKVTFTAWCQLHKDTKAHDREKIDRSLRRLRNRHLAAGFLSWLAAVERSAAQDAMLALCIQNFVMRARAAALRKWIQHVEERLERDAKLRRSFAFMTNRLVAMTWRGWCTLMVLAEERAERLRPFINRLMRRLTSLTFDAWLRFLDRRHVRRDQSRTAAVHRARTLVGRHLDAWRGKNAGLSRAARHLLNSSLARGLNSWRQTASEQRAAMDKLLVAARRWNNQKLTGCYGTWRDVAAARTEALRLMTNAAQAMRSRGLRAAMNTWAEQSDEAARKRQAARRGVLHMLHRGLSLGWNAWLEHLRELKGLRRILMRITQRVLCACWEAWAGEVQNSRHISQTAFSKAEACAMRMQNLELGRGFNSLQDALRRRERYRALLRRVASPRLLAALNSWQALVEERNEQMRRLRRAAQFMVNGLLVLIFRNWAKYGRRRQSCRAAAAEVRRAKCADLLRSWAYARFLSGQASSHLRAVFGRTLSVIFEAWVEYAIESIAEREALERQIEQLQRLGEPAADILRLSCRQWRWSHQARALATWVGVLGASARALELGGAAAHHFVTGKLGLAWRHWAASSRRLVAVKLSLARWVMRAAAMAMMQWRSVTLRWRNERLGALASCLHFEGALTLKSFYGWRKQARRQATVRLLGGEKGRGSMLRRGWVALHNAATKQASIVTRIEVLWLRRTTTLARVALHAWSHGGAHQQRRQQQAELALAYWGGASRRSCWVIWRQLVREGAKGQGLLHTSLAKLRNSALTRCYTSWYGFAAERAEALAKMRRAVMRCTNRAMAMCFSACVQLVVEKRQKEQQALQCLRRVLHRQLVMAWEGWRYYLLERRHANAASKAMAARAFGRDLAAALWTWRAQYAESLHGARIEAALGEHMFALASRCLSGMLRLWRKSHWQERVLLRIQRRDIEMQADALRDWARQVYLLRRVGEMGFESATRQTARRLQRWQQHASHRAQLRLREQYLHSRTRWYARQTMMRHWQDAKKARHNMRRALARYCFSLCYRVLLAWHSHVGTARAARDELLRAHANQLALEQHRRRARARLQNVVFGAWRELACGRARRRRLSRMGLLMVAMRRWVERAAREARLGEAFYVVTQRRMCRSMLVVVHAWRAYLQEQLHLRAAAEADLDVRLANAAGYHLQRLGGLVFFHWRALSWSRNWEKPGRYNTEQRKQRQMAAMLVQGSVAHQSTASRAFQQGLYTPAKDSPLSTPQHRSSRSRTSRPALPESPGSPGSPPGSPPGSRVLPAPDLTSPMGLKVAVALGSHLVDEEHLESRRRDAELRSAERRMSSRMSAAADSSRSQRGRGQMAGRRLFESNQLGGGAGGFASFDDWMALNAKG